MNSIAKISVALLAGLGAVAPAVAGSDAAVVSAVLEPQYWVMALAAIALVGLALGRGRTEAAADAERNSYTASNRALA